MLVATAGCGRIAFDPRTHGASGDSALLVCPPGYTADSGGCYRTGAGTAGWVVAEAACEADGIGAHLAVIDNAAEAAVVDRYRPAPTDLAWIGLTDRVTEGTYMTVTNVPAPYLVFAAGEPDGVTPDCILLGENLQLGDTDCATADDYICEYDGIPAVSAAWGVCLPGYTAMAGGCYRFVDADLDWYEAEAACEADGPGCHLVILDSTPEAMVVDTVVPGSILDHFVGATDLVTEGTFIDIAGNPIGFMTWHAAEPDGGTIQNCLLLTDAVELKDGDCDTLGDDYVCECDGITPVPASWGR